MKKIAMIALSACMIISTKVSFAQQPEGSKVEAFVRKGNIGFAGTRAGMFMSVDSGKNWAPANNGIGEWESVLHLAAGKKYVMGTTSGSRLWITTNDGKSWTKELPDISVTGVAFFNDQFFIASSSGIMATGEDKLDWKPVAGVPVIRFDNIFSSPDHILAEIWEKRYFYSEDGKKWNEVKPTYRVGKIRQEAKYIAARYCTQNLGHTDGTFSCEQEELTILSKNGKAWELVPFQARYFGFDDEDIYAITSELKSKKKGEFAFNVDVLVSKNGGKKWSSTGQEADPENANYSIREKLKEILASAEGKIAFAKRGAAARKLIDEEFKAQQAKVEAMHHTETIHDNMNNDRKSPDYRALSNDRFKEMNNHRDSWIDSRGGAHIH